VQADSRIIANENKPSCPFPAKVELVPPLTQGRVAIGVPIDVPFTEVNRLLETQLKGKSFPEDGSGPVGVTVQRAKVAASGDRLLISLLVNAKEKKSFLGFGGVAESTVGADKCPTNGWACPSKKQRRSKMDGVSRPKRMAVKHLACQTEYILAQYHDIVSFPVFVEAEG
jgi:hypothetical protein